MFPQSKIPELLYNTYRKPNGIICAFLHSNMDVDTVLKQQLDKQNENSGNIVHSLLLKHVHTKFIDYHILNILHIHRL